MNFKKELKSWLCAALITLVDVISTGARLGIVGFIAFATFVTLYGWAR